MSADRFYNAIPQPNTFKQSVIVSFFVYYLTVELGQDAATAEEVAKCYEECDLTVPSRLAVWLSEGLSGSPSFYVKAPRGYRLHREHREWLSSKLGTQRVATQTSIELRRLETLFREGPTKTYLMEAIDCFEAGANRAAIIMTWVLTMDHLNNHIFTKRLADFNAALSKNPDRKIKAIAANEDFSDLKESKIIELCRAAGIISGDVQKVLKDGLDTRNSCAHPSDVKVARSKAIAVIEDLVTNVIRRF